MHSFVISPIEWAVNIPFKKVLVSISFISVSSFLLFSVYPEWVLLLHQFLSCTVSILPEKWQIIKWKQELGLHKICKTTRMSRDFKCFALYPQLYDVVCSVNYPKVHKKLGRMQSVMEGWPQLRFTTLSIKK